MTASSPPPDPVEKAPESSAPRASGSAAASGPQLPLGYAAIIAVLLVLAAIGGGLAIGTIVRPQPTPRPTPTVAVPTPTPEPTTDPAVFRQALTGACATEQGIWVVTNGGGLLRYDGRDWAQVDGTLRTLTQAACDRGALYAVGPVGAVLIIDDRARSISAFDVTMADLIGVAAMPQGAMAVGSQGTVMLLSGGSWQVYAQGIEEDLNAIVAFDRQSAWVVGALGVSYRLESAGWRSVPTGVTVALRAVTGTGPQSAIAAGDGGTLLIFDGTWKPRETGVTADLRSIARLGGVMWIVGDGGTVLTLGVAGGDPAPPASAPLGRLDLGTTCDLRSVFVNGPDVWVVGSTGARGGVWRIRGDKVAERWGEC